MSKTELDNFAAILKRNLIELPKGVSLEVRDVDYEDFGVPEPMRDFSHVEYNSKLGIKFILHKKINNE